MAAIGRPNGPAYSTGELLNTSLVFVGILHAQIIIIADKSL